MQRSLSFFRLALLLALVALVAACDDGRPPFTDDDGAQVSTTSPPDVTTAGTIDADADFALAGLPDGTHLGISAFSPPASEFADEWIQRWNEANDAASVGRVLIDWVDIEPARGQYETVDLDEQLAEIVERGQVPMVTIAAVDVSGTPFPDWLGGFEADAAASAYNDMIDAVAPTLDRHGVWLLAVANEPPFDDGLDRAEFAQFVRGVNDHVDQAIPGLATTFVFAGGDALTDDAGIDALHASVDVFALNHYCIDELLFATPIDEAGRRLQQILDRGDGRPIVFQELGCPAAESMGSSEEMQAEWFEQMFTSIQAEPSVRSAFVFEFQDWSTASFEANYGGAFDDEPEIGEFAIRFEDWLLTSGLFREDMSPRPAYAVFLEAAER